MNKILILKGIVEALQVGLIILLITSGLHFKDVRAVKAYLEAFEKYYKNISEYPEFEKFVTKIHMKYFALLGLIILSTVKVPVVAAGLFLNHVNILFGSILIDTIVGSLYIVQWGVITEVYTAGSWLGILSSSASKIMAAIFIRFTRNAAK